jgi:hypothetical protein
MRYRKNSAFFFKKYLFFLFFTDGSSTLQLKNTSEIILSILKSPVKFAMNQNFSLADLRSTGLSSLSALIPLLEL